MRTIARLTTGSEVDVTLHDGEGESVPLRAEVLWVNPADVDGGPLELGLRLLEVPPRYHALLSKLFAEN